MKCKVCGNKKIQYRRTIIKDNHQAHVEYSTYCHKCGDNHIYRIERMTLLDKIINFIYK